MNPEPTQLLGRLRQAQEAFMAREYRAALEHYQWVEERLGEDLEALPLIWMEMGWCHFFLQEYPAAMERFSSVLAKSSQLSDQQVFDTLRLMGFSHKATGNPDRAIAFLQDAVARPVPEPEKRHAYFELGRLFFTQDLSREAKTYLEKAEHLFGEEEGEYRQSTRYYLGFASLVGGDPDRAEALFRDYLNAAANPAERAPGHFGLAHVHYAAANYRAVIDSCQAVVDGDPDFFDRETVAFFLCRSFAELREWDQLETFLSPLMETFPEGRYKAAYPALLKALHYRQPPPPLPGSPASKN